MLQSLVNPILTIAAGRASLAHFPLTELVPFPIADIKSLSVAEGHDLMNVKAIFLSNSANFSLDVPLLIISTGLGATAGKFLKSESPPQLVAFFWTGQTKLGKSVPESAAGDPFHAGDESLADDLY